MTKIKTFKFRALQQSDHQYCKNTYNIIDKSKKFSKIMF